MGNYSKAMINEAIDEYIAINYTKKVKPLINMRLTNGKAKYNSATATKEVKKNLLQNYT